MNRGRISEMRDLMDLSWWTLWVGWGDPYEIEWSDPNPNPIYMIRIDENWMNWSEMRELMRWTLWESPYESWYKWFYEFDWNWSDSMRNEWIEVEWVNRGEMSDLMEVRENNSMGRVLWVEWEVPYENDLDEWSDPNPNPNPNPIKMIRIDENWMNWSE